VAVIKEETMAFDVIKFLEDYDIPHKTAGKGTTRGWVQLQCPFCYDHSWHLGVNIREGYFHCWICHKAGKPETLIYNLLKISFRRCKAIVEEYGGAPEETEARQHANEVKMKGVSTLQPIHINYLKQRDFDPITIERKYKIGACYTTGRFPYRIVIPVFDDGTIVNATARDVTGKQPERYMSLTNEEAVVPIKECVYNIDAIRGDNILIVEGPFDVWRIGGATVSLFGTAFKMAQVMRIASKCPTNAYIMFDNEPEAQRNASKLASCLSPLVRNVEILEISQKDPAMLTQKEAEEIRNELNI
jgi:DNA primase